MTRTVNLFRVGGDGSGNRFLCYAHALECGSKCKNADLLNNITGTAERYQLEKSTNIRRRFLLADDKHGTKAEASF